jgi:hypothetical protein
MRALKIATIVMGVLIVLCTGGLLTMMVKRSSPSPIAAPADMHAMLAEPPGSRIVAISVIQDRLALLLQGGGTDRIVLVDPRTGKAAGRISLKPE